MRKICIVMGMASVIILFVPFASFIPIIHISKSDEYSNIISYIYTFLGFFISLYTLYNVENVKEILVQNKHNIHLEELVNIIEKVFNYLDGIENGDSDGDSDGNKRELEFKQVKNDLRKKYDNVEGFGFKFELLDKINSSFCEKLYLHPLDEKQKIENNKCRKTLENLKWRINQKLAERKGESTNEKI